MFTLKIRTLLLVITLLSPTVFSCAKCIFDIENKTILLIDLNEEEEEEQGLEEVKEADVSEEYTCLLARFQLKKVSKSNARFLSKFLQNVDLTIVSPPPEFS